MHSKETAFSDFVAHRYITSNQTVTKAAVECYEFLLNLDQKEVKNHPQIELYCQLAGIYDRDILNSHLVGFLLQFYENISQHGLTFANAIEYLTGRFANN